MTSRPRVRSAPAHPAFPYEIVCTACDAPLVAVDRERIVLIGPRPIEIVAGLNGDAHIACHRCGNMVLLDGGLLLLR